MILPDAFLWTSRGKPEASCWPGTSSTSGSSPGTSQSWLCSPERPRKWLLNSQELASVSGPSVAEWTLWDPFFHGWWTWFHGWTRVSVLADVFGQDRLTCPLLPGHSPRWLRFTKVTDITLSYWILLRTEVTRSSWDLMCLAFITRPLSLTNPETLEKPGPSMTGLKSASLKEPLKNVLSLGVKEA